MIHCCLHTRRAAIREIRAAFPAASICMVTGCMVTGFDHEDLRREALTARASGFVLKEKRVELASRIEL